MSICIALYHDSSPKRSGMAHVNEGSHSFNCHPHVYPQVEWTISAFTPQLQSITALWLVLISCPAEGRRLTWPGGDNVPYCVGTLAAPGKYDWTCASFGPPSLTPKWQIDRFNHFCTSHGRKSLYLTMGDPVPQNSPFSWGIWTSSNSWFLGPVRVHNPNDITIGSAVFAQVTTECPYTLQGAAHYPLKIAPSHRVSGPHSNTWFPGQSKSPTQTASVGVSIGSAVFAGLTTVTDRPTDHTTQSVTIDHIYVRSTGDAV